MNKRTGLDFMKAKRKFPRYVRNINATGTEKIPLAVIVRAKNPRILDRHGIPEGIHYFHQKNAWIDANIFTNWMQDIFIPTVRKTTSKKMS